MSAVQGVFDVTQTGYAIFLNGGYGVGKSSALEHVGDLLARAGRPFSLMDVDWFHRSWPPGEQENAQIEAANIAAVWKNYQTAGPRQLVICGVISTAAARERYAAAVEVPIRMVRLTAAGETVRQRLRGRYSPSRQSALEWHLARCDEIADRLEVADLDELVIDTTTLEPHEVAERTLQHFGLLDNSMPNASNG
jgi:chloramphenicol 3-O-phosphotransferase